IRLRTAQPAKQVRKALVDVVDVEGCDLHVTAPSARDAVRGSKAEMDRRPRNHQPEYCENRSEGGKAAGKPEPEKPVISGRKCLTAARRFAGKAAHAHLYPDNGKPEQSCHEIQNERQRDPSFRKRIAGFARKQQTSDRLRNDGCGGEDKI